MTVPYYGPEEGDSKLELNRLRKKERRYMKMKNLLMTLLFVMLLSIAFPFTAWGGEWTDLWTVKSVHVQPNGNVYVTVSTDTPNLGCELYANGILQLDTSAPNFKGQYSLLIATQLSARQVKIYVKGCGDAYAFAQNTNMY